jgi:hypothetical protein
MLLHSLKLSNESQNNTDPTVRRSSGQVSSSYKNDKLVEDSLDPIIFEYLLAKPSWQRMNKLSS